MRNYPVVPVRTVTDEYFGIKVEDPYRYLEDAKSEETLGIVAAQNAYTHAFFEAAEAQGFSVKAAEARIRAEKVAGKLSGISEACGCRYAARELEGGIHDIVALNEDYSVDRIVLDEAMLNGTMHVFSVSANPKHAGIFAVMGVIHGHPRCCVLVWDANKGEKLAELDDTFGYAWSPDGEAIWYSDAKISREENRNINRILRWNLATRTLDDLYTYQGNAVFIECSPIENGGCILGVLCTYDDIKVMYMAPDGSVTPLTDGVGSYGYIGAHDGMVYFTTNVAAPMSRLVGIPAAALTEENALMNAAQVIVPEQEARLAAAGVIPDGILTVYEQHAVFQVSLTGFDGKKLRDIALPEAYGAVSFSEGVEASDAGAIYFSFESFTQKSSMYRLDAADLTCRQVTGKAGDTSDIAVDQCFFPARDGQQILCYLVRPADLKPNGETPVLMYGYGGYAVSSNPWPEDMVTGHNVVDWVRQGRIYVHCCIRGGMEYGTSWHEAAMKDHKKNAFCDFIDTAEYLVKQGWTKPGQIVATGLSNGGLLMTAITTMRPDLFGVVIASVPHTDMLRFRNDDRGMMYVTEYGDPLGSEEMFRYMHSYSPYHNIKPGTVYPWIYVQTGECDNNVPPYHGKKFAVRLQAAADEAHPVLLQVLATGSHDRGVGDEYYMNVAQMQTFVEMGLAA